MTLDAQPISSRRTETPWWKRGVIYQIYPRSFQDTDRDGVGDLQGIRQRLDYLAWLGVDAIWISPIYPSPMADFGYDVADYCDVDPIFGTLEEFDDLIADAHRRGLKLILDFVPNPTWDRPPRFPRAAPRARTRSGTGICGGTRSPTARPRTTGSAISAVRPGPSTRRRASTTITRSCASSPTSTGAIRP